MARFDLLRATAGLARMITKWDLRCDRKLHKLVEYIKSTADSNKMVGWIGDDQLDLDLVLFSDADFAGCMATSKSTTGAFLTLRGPDTRFPLSATSQKQGCVSKSTTEAETVAANHGLQVEGIPAI